MLYDSIVQLYRWNVSRKIEVWAWMDGSGSNVSAWRHFPGSEGILVLCWSRSISNISVDFCKDFRDWRSSARSWDESKRRHRAAMGIWKVGYGRIIRMDEKRSRRGSISAINRHSRRESIQYRTAETVRWLRFFAEQAAARCQNNGKMGAYQDPTKRTLRRHLGDIICLSGA